MCSNHKKTPDVAVALFSDVAEPILAAAGVLAWDKPKPSRELTPRSEQDGICDGRDNSAGRNRTDAGNCLKSSAGSIRSMPGVDVAIKLADPFMHLPQLSDQRP